MVIKMAKLVIDVSVHYKEGDPHPRLSVRR
jgi:hypothetical protein